MIGGLIVRRRAHLISAMEDVRAGKPLKPVGGK